MDGFGSLELSPYSFLKDDSLTINGEKQRIPTLTSATLQELSRIHADPTLSSFSALAERSEQGESIVPFNLSSDELSVLLSEMNAIQTHAKSIASAVLDDLHKQWKNIPGSVPLTQIDAFKSSQRKLERTKVSDISDLVSVDEHESRKREKKKKKKHRSSSNYDEDYTTTAKTKTVSDPKEFWKLLDPFFDFPSEKHLQELIHSEESKDIFQVPLLGPHFTSELPIDPEATSSRKRKRKSASWAKQFIPSNDRDVLDDKSARKRISALEKEMKPLPEFQKHSLMQRLVAGFIALPPERSSSSRESKAPSILNLPIDNGKTTTSVRNKLSMEERLREELESVKEFGFEEFVDLSSAASRNDDAICLVLRKQQQVFRDIEKQNAEFKELARRKVDELSAYGEVKDKLAKAEKELLKAYRNNLLKKSNEEKLQKALERVKELEKEWSVYYEKYGETGTGFKCSIEEFAGAPQPI